MSFDALFTPFTLGSLSLPNRIVMAPMTRSFSPGGLPTAQVAAYYRRRAEGGAGLIVTEGTAIERLAAKNHPDVPDFHGAALGEWERIVGEVHAAGGRVAPQLWHVGGTPEQRAAGWSPAPVDSPSGLHASGERYAEPMTEEAIADTIAAYARAAGAARAMGCDAVELHGAHGYLIDQFLWGQVNTRADRWGGANLLERARFAIEVVKAVRRALGETMPLLLRLSQWKIRHYEVKLAQTPDELGAWLEPLAEAGVDVFHCSQRRFWEPEFEGSDLNFAGWTKKLTGKATITVGSVGLDTPERARASINPWSIQEAVRRLERGDYDLVAVGRAMIAAPDWANRLKRGELDELAPFDPAQLQTLR